MKAYIPLFGLVLVGVGSPAQADLVPVSQTRTVEGTAFANDFGGPVSDSDSEAAANFGPFSESVSASAVVSAGSAAGTASQTSTISATGIQATGTSESSSERNDFFVLATGSGASVFSVTFELAEDMTYSVTGELTSLFASGAAHLSLSDAGGEIFTATATGPSSIEPLDDSGVLPQGQYTLEISADGTVSGAPFSTEFSSSSYDVSFQVASVQAVPTVGTAASLALVLGLALLGIPILRHGRGVST